MLLFGPLALAQEADSLVLPADSLATGAPVVGDSLVVSDTLAIPADTLGADTLAATPAPVRQAVGFAVPEPGRIVSAIPTRRPVFSAAELVGALPGAFHYDLGVPGWPDGVAFGGTAPHQASLTLDGLPVMDLFSGRPAWEMLPLDALAPLRLNPRYGAPAGVDATLRAFAARIPVTELRYRTGPDGIQFISATHAQTRRPDWLQRLGGERARLQALAHVSGRQADGEYPGSEVRGWQLFARVGVALPAFSLELTERHGRDRSGAQSGVVLSPDAPFANVFDRERAEVGDEQAERETIRNDLGATLRLPLSSEPLTATLFWTAETFHYLTSATSPDSITARGDRVGLRVVQPLRLGPNRLFARVDAWLDRADPTSAYASPESERAIHLALLDSLTVAGFDLALTGGLHSTPSATFPTFGARVERTVLGLRLFADVQRAGATGSRMERHGFGSLLAARASERAERVLSLAAGFDASVGPFDIGLSARALQQTDPRVLVTTDSLPSFVNVDGSFRRAMGTLSLGWRDRARRGLYVRVRANAHALLNPDDSDFHRREAEAVPPLWGHARLGIRALGLFENNLDLDLAVRARGWLAFRSRVLHAPTALYALPAADARELPTRGTLDAVIEAAVGKGRATVFLAYENFLASRAYDGAVIVPVYPLANPRLRFGIFWLLPN